MYGRICARAREQKSKRKGDQPTSGNKHANLKGGDWGKIVCGDV